MIKLITGKKGSGKTKKIIEMANNSQKNCHGSIVFLDDDNKYMYDLHHQVRFINVNDFDIKNADVLEGVIIGLLAGNFDMEVIYIDGLLRMVCEKPEELQTFFTALDKLTKSSNVEIVMTVSAHTDELPTFIRQYAI